MDAVSAKVLGTGAIVFGLIFIVTSIVRLSRPDLDVLLAVLNIIFGALLIYTGFRLWRSALRGTNRDR
jgi:threonine/homoserine/homoserine lactone efflux protein